MDRFNSNEEPEATPLSIAKDIIYSDGTMDEKVKQIESAITKASKNCSIPAARYQLAISALEAIIDPIGHMKKQLKEDERLDGMYAIRIAERPEYYQDIARKALEEIANCT